MHPAGLFNKSYIMNEIKDYNTNLVTMDAELFKQIKILAAQLNKDQNHLLEEAAQDLINKYKHTVSSLNLWRFPNSYSGDSSQIEILRYNLHFFELWRNYDIIIINRGRAKPSSHTTIFRGGSKPGWAALSISYLAKDVIFWHICTFGIFQVFSSQVRWHLVFCHDIPNLESMIFQHI